MNSNRSQSETPETPEEYNVFRWPLIKPDMGAEKRREKPSKIEQAWRGREGVISSFGTG